MYVDPSIYASADDAVRDFAKEIPPKMLTIKEEIGRGELCIQLHALIVSTH